MEHIPDVSSPKFNSVEGTQTMVHGSWFKLSYRSSLRVIVPPVILLLGRAEFMSGEAPTLEWIASPRLQEQDRRLCHTQHL
jgi:hypothetical protein